MTGSSPNGQGAAPVAKVEVARPLPRSLRLAAEPYTYVTEAEVHAALVRDPRSYIDHLEHTLTGLMDKSCSMELPPKQVFDDGPGKGDFRVMPCIVRGASVLKTVKVIGTNRRQRLVPEQITVGKLLVLDPIENFITHVFEACLLSSARTGACAAVAIRKLQPARERVVIVGAGRVGFYAGLFANSLGGVNEIICCDRVRARSEQVAGDLAPMVSARVRAADYREIEAANVLVLATDAEVPVYHRRDFWADLVVSLGADTDSQSEIDLDPSEHPRVYVDHPHSASCGDLKRWLAAGYLQATDIHSFFDMMNQDVSGGDRPKVFISTGSALFDNMTVSYYLANQVVHRRGAVF